LTRKPRTDAEHNQRQIVAVARAAFAADGLDLPIREIAGRAGLGAATIYRHFPSRSDLVSAVLAEQVALCGADMRDALADPDPWHALRGIIRRFAEHQVRDRRLNEALLGSHPAGASFAGQRRAHARALTQLVDRARDAGAVRDGVSADDVRVGLLAMSSFQALPAAKAAIATTRLASLLLTGLSQQKP
jgi:AcrR family transcriptional regulator